MYVIVWEFEVKAEKEEEFAGVYGADGEWAKLFSRAAGFLGTELWKEMPGGIGASGKSGNSKDAIAKDGASEREDSKSGEMKSEDAKCGEAENGSPRYLTIDRWESASAFEAFQRQFGEAYRELDRKCEGLTVSERKIGAFTN